MTVVGRVDPRCSRGLRVLYDVRVCPSCVGEGAAATWQGVSVGADGAATRVVSPFRFELRVHADQVELWHRISRDPAARGVDRAEAEALLDALLEGGCAHG